MSVKNRNCFVHQSTTLDINLLTKGIRQNARLDFADCPNKVFFETIAKLQFSSSYENNDHKFVEIDSKVYEKTLTSLLMNAADVRKTKLRNGISELGKIQN